MNVKIACVGKLKDRFYIDAADEYGKRLTRFVALETCEVRDERIPENASAAETRLAVEREGERLLARIAENEYVVALCIGGKRYTSESFAAHIQALSDAGRAHVTFVVGGSCGLSERVLSRASERLSLSDMTMPHRLCRVFLLEQIYRACKINAGETYHK